MGRKGEGVDIWPCWLRHNPWRETSVGVEQGFHGPKKKKKQNKKEQSRQDKINQALKFVLAAKRKHL